MYLFQSETETHFQCPECGQRGAVLTKDFDQAVKTSPYVRITCTSCQSKFEPNHRASPEAFASTIATTINVPELAAAFEEVATPAPDDLPIIDDEFGALPAWLRPDYKDDATASGQTEAAANTEKTPDSKNYMGADQDIFLVQPRFSWGRQSRVCNHHLLLLG